MWELKQKWPLPHAATETSQDSSSCCVNGPLVTNQSSQLAGQITFGKCFLSDKLLLQNVPEWVKLFGGLTCRGFASENSILYSFKHVVFVQAQTYIYGSNLNMIII